MTGLISTNSQTLIKAIASYFPSIKTLPRSTKTIRSKDVVAGDGFYKVSTPPAAIPLSKIILGLPKMFPLSSKESYADYCQFQKDPIKFQTDLFSELAFFPSPHNNIQSQFIETDVGDNDFINEFCVEPCATNDSTKYQKDLRKHLIIVHGYGAGLGFFIKNIESLAKNLISDNWSIHAIDLPGYGFSSRNKFPFRIDQNTHEQVEEWFHKKINRWLQKRGLLDNPDQNVVLAHSMGAYLMATYAARPKFNNHWSKLIMCSPGGITSSKIKSNPPYWFVKLWNDNYSPFSIVRNLSAIGSKVTSGWTSRRFSKMGENSTKLKSLMHRYTYGIFNSRGSGEYMLSFFLKCGGDPRHPLEQRLFSQRTNNSILKNNKMEWLWLYGENDWMNVNGGTRSSNFLNQNSIKSKVIELPKAGHHLYLDRPDDFNTLIVKELRSK